MDTSTHHPAVVHLAVIGHGKVGGEFIDQVIRAHGSLIERMHLDLRIFAVANSRRCLLAAQGVGADWRQCIAEAGEVEDIHSLITQYAQDQNFEHLIMVDNTSSEDVARAYQHYISLGYDIVSANKKPNTQPWHEYKALRRCLAQYNRSYRYETNVGAGLPLIDNIKMLHLSGERIRSIRGVFSGSLSFIFNQLDVRPAAELRDIVREATELGYAEPDVRDDLSGEDVARKLLILARELDIEASLEDVVVEHMVPEELARCSYEAFEAQFDLLIDYIAARQRACPPGHVLRYVAEVIWDDVLKESSLRASLVPVPSGSVIGSLRSADCCFQIYTESYGERPITVQGAGAGTRVTARGVFGDVLRLCDGLE